MIASSKFAVFALLFAAGSACAQEEDPHFDRVVRPWMEKFVDCEKAQLVTVANTDVSLNEAANAAFSACKEERRLLTNVYQRPPYSLGTEDAEGIVQELVDELRPLVEKDIRHLRGQ
ncbi:hypothetical protein [Dongia sedimenti]|uniref:Uncharacterized protein n=1 Tax=Dongia sedimenti TaxID=3064282 RepID=A0ABU0YTI0_9PROT|nr:hypothetical protein [Rhodospirillaceae bacterium R-7]